MKSDREYKITNHEGYSCRERACTAGEAIRKAAAKRPGYDPERCRAVEVMAITAATHTRKGVEKYKEKGYV